MLDCLTVGEGESLSLKIHLCAHMMVGVCCLGEEMW